MKKYITIVIILIIIIAAVAVWRHNGASEATPDVPDTSTVATTLYTCDGGKTIAVAKSADSVEISLSGGASTTLQATATEGEGTRYENADKTLAFWNQGNEALIMRNNSMDMEYRNCMTE